MKYKKIFFGFPLILTLLHSATVLAEENFVQTESSGYTSQVQKSRGEYKPNFVEERINEQQSKIIQDAVIALKDTHVALDALEENDADRALKALEEATGKLELVLAREPSLALAPISLAVFTQDIYATPEMIKNIVSQVRMLIATNDLQKARLLMSNLGSDITLRVTNLPLATYPSAIKLAASLIGQKEFDKAQKTLKTALATLVITTEVIPLPYIRSESLLATIEIYSKEQIDNQVKDKNDRLAAINIMLHAIREELNLAENLGYAKKHEHKPVYKALDSIEKKINKNKPIQDDLFEAKKYLLELISKGV